MTQSIDDGGRSEGSRRCIYIHKTVNCTHFIGVGVAYMEKTKRTNKQKSSYQNFQLYSIHVISNRSSNSRA